MEPWYISSRTCCDNVIPRKGRDQTINGVKMLNIEKREVKTPVILCHLTLIMPVIVLLNIIIFCFLGKRGLDGNFLVRHWTSDLFPYSLVCLTNLYFIWLPILLVSQIRALFWILRTVWSAICDVNTPTSLTPNQNIESSTCMLAVRLCWIFSTVDMGIRFDRRVCLIYNGTIYQHESVYSCIWLSKKIHVPAKYM